jgi:tetratricopeptide (TPR) repeat protein
MKRIFLSVILSSFVWVNALYGQSHDEVVVAAYAMTHTPSGIEFKETKYSPTTQAMLELDLEIAKVAFQVAPDREDSYSWLGRRYGYLGMLPEAIGVFSEGLKKFPNSYKLYRYRGRHLARNYQFGQAISDYHMALELIKDQPDTYEPNGIPNALDLTISTFKQNIPYYLGQTSMATGDYETVIKGMDEAINVPVLFAYMEELIPVTLWKYLALRKLGRHGEAEAELKKVPDQYDLIENDQYHNAVNYLKGMYTRDEFLAMADGIGKYVIAMKDHFDGDNESAIKLWTEVTNDGPRGFWPAEAELKFLREK